MITLSWREKKPDTCQSVCENSPAPSDGFYKQPSFHNQTSTRLEDVSDASGVCGSPIKSRIETTSNANNGNKANKQTMACLCFANTSKKKKNRKKTSRLKESMKLAEAEL